MEGVSARARVQGAREAAAGSEAEAEGAGEAEREGVRGVCERERRLRRTGAASDSCTSTASPWLRTAPRSPPSRLATTMMGCEGSPVAVAASAGRPIPPFAGQAQTPNRSVPARRALGEVVSSVLARIFITTTKQDRRFLYNLTEGLFWVGGMLQPARFVFLFS